LIANQPSARKSRSRGQRNDVLWAGNGLCHICGKRINPVRDEWEVEHTVPIALGGADFGPNVRPAHSACHAAKTQADVKQIAKAKRVAAKHEGTFRPTRHPLSHPHLKRGVNGKVVRRDAGGDCNV